MADNAMPQEQEAPIRSRTYTLLGGLIAAPPAGDLLQALAAAQVDAGAGPLAAAWHELAVAAGEVNAAAADDEFHDLFIGLGRGEVVPYASWYVSGFMMGRPLVALRSELRALGFERQAEVHEPEDHVAALFDVMAALADAEHGEPVATQQRFFANHLAPWLEHFMSDLASARSARFYRAVGRLGERFAVLEKQYLGLAEGGIRTASAG